MAEFFERQDVVVTCDVEGTGVRRGDIGKVVFMRRGGRDIDRSTDLVSKDIQVRFKGGAEILKTKAQIAPPAQPAPLSEEVADA
jgi:hypothetical protein